MFQEEDKDDPGDKEKEVSPLESGGEDIGGGNGSDDDVELLYEVIYIQVGEISCLSQFRTCMFNRS